MPNEIIESELIEIEVELQVFDKVSLAVEAAKEECAKIVLKYDTPKDIKDAKSFIYDIRLLKAPITQAHKMAKAQLLVDGRAMDAKKNMLIGALEEMIEEKYAPIKLIEDAEKKDAEEIEAWAMQGEICEQEAKQAEHDAAQKKLAEVQAELAAKQAEFDRKERDARIAEEATKKAEYDAEIARIRTERMAEQSRADAAVAAKYDVQRVKDKAAAEAQEKERAVMEEQRIAREKKAEEEMAETERINDEAHRSKVHRAIWRTFHEGTCLNDSQSRAVTQALIDGRIPNVTINY